MTDIIGTTGDGRGATGAGGCREAAKLDRGGRDFLIHSSVADSPPGARADHATLHQLTLTC